jgi:hypothetical protein
MKGSHGRSGHEAPGVENRGGTRGPSRGAPPPPPPGDELRTRGATGRCLAIRAHHRGSRGALDDVATRGARHPRRAQHHATRSLPARRMTGRGCTREGANAVGAAITLPVGARTTARGVRGTTDVAGRRAATEGAMAAPPTGTNAIGAGGVAGNIVPVATNVTGRRATREIAAVAQWAVADSISTVSGGLASLDHGADAAGRSDDGDQPEGSHEAARTLARVSPLGHPTARRLAPACAIARKIRGGRLVFQR